ncbi:hypothetical protein PS357_08310 [Acinetobacter nosocomialis]|uniref:hypothetical protein n=1 Tax=Acinetobacter nosocomialis TaxID=106654 RepID=UPI00235FFDED|nr:hypothetical protein [Acinetobacter nosocomialis]MDC9815749.1 hypothetical protein [Acinetobacter nosocomialis]MDE9404971.1 hypothetical protein [Acinetobacter nosocomialis]HDG9761545.1 hypothetical protein [Acinetobacter nosocomialis]
MDNYKIKVKDEAESKEAQELFVQLGFEKTGFTCDEFPCYLATWEGGFSDYVLDSLSISRERKELTLPQLRDLVVLKRNDVKDATHRDKVIYYWQGEWCKSAINKSNDYENYIANSLTPITQPQDPALISGADVLRALADGKEVEGFSEENEEWIPIVYFSVQEVVNGLYKFRLKPQTIKLELELPKPFEPEEDCHVYILDDGKTDGYRRYSYEVHGDKGNTFIGIWRTEEEIKQVVEQLRKIRGAS